MGLRMYLRPFELSHPNLLMRQLLAYKQHLRYHEASSIRTYKAVRFTHKIFFNPRQQLSWEMGPILFSRNTPTLINSSHTTLISKSCPPRLTRTRRCCHSKRPMTVRVRTTPCISHNFNFRNIIASITINSSSNSISNSISNSSNNNRLLVLLLRRQLLRRRPLALFLMRRFLCPGSSSNSSSSSSSL